MVALAVYKCQVASIVGRYTYRLHDDTAATTRLLTASAVQALFA